MGTSGQEKHSTGKLHDDDDLDSNDGVVNSSLVKSLGQEIEDSLVGCCHVLDDDDETQLRTLQQCSGLLDCRGITYVIRGCKIQTSVPTLGAVRPNASQRLLPARATGASLCLVVWFFDTKRSRGIKTNEHACVAAI